MNHKSSDLIGLKSAILQLLNSWQVITDTQMLHLNTYGASELKVKWPGDFGILEIYRGIKKGKERYINYTFEKVDGTWIIDFFEYNKSPTSLN